MFKNTFLNKAIFGEAQKNLGHAPACSLVATGLHPPSL